jgi:hypothetical protein
MPRLSARKYLQASKRLRRYWYHQQMAYGYLTAAEQWQLHDFFKPTKDWTDDEVLAHRAEITTQRPSLPHQAGRALAKIDEIAPQLAVIGVRRRHAPPAKPARRTNVRDQDRHITVRAVVKPEIDTERLAKVVIAMAEHLAKQKAEQRGKDEPTVAA